MKALTESSSGCARSIIMRYSLGIFIFFGTKPIALIDRLGEWGDVNKPNIRPLFTSFCRKLHMIGGLSRVDFKFWTVTGVCSLAVPA